MASKRRYALVPPRPLYFSILFDCTLIPRPPPPRFDSSSLCSSYYNPELLPYCSLSPRATPPSLVYCNTEPLPSLNADVRPNSMTMPPSQPGDSPTHKTFGGVKSKRECEEQANAVADAVAYEWRADESGYSPLCQVFTEDDVVQAVDEGGHECYVLAAGKTRCPASARSYHHECQSPPPFIRAMYSSPC